MDLHAVRHCPLSIDRWNLGEDEVWCVLSSHGAGKTALGQLLCGELRPTQGAVNGRPQPAALVSLETQQALYEEELKRDDSDWLDGVDEGRTVGELLAQSGKDAATCARWAAEMGLSALLQRGIRRLSSGETRALLLTQALLCSPALLVVDEPFSGLDSEARTRALRQLEAAHRSGTRLVLLVDRLSDVPELATHVALLHGGKLLRTGTRAAVLRSPEVGQLWTLVHRAPPPLPPGPDQSAPLPQPLLRLRGCEVRYGAMRQFSDFSWTLDPGQHTLITGPNGCGKSTLLQLLCGDHPQCYANDLQIFGFQRGSGESIWDIKQHIGLVSADLHRDYRVNSDTLTTVVSGLYDTIGIYRAIPQQHRVLAARYLDLLGLGADAKKSFRQLSYGQQRLLLIARALIKQPPLLILDEPTEGLDDLNRQLVLCFIAQLAQLERTTLLFVTHRDDEHLPLFRYQLRFMPSERTDQRYRIEQIERRADADG